jgi:hypothetical protein
MKRHRTWLRLAPLLVTLPGVGFLHRSLLVERHQLGLVRGRELEAAPPALAFTTVAFGAFRGLVVNGLWSRAVQLQDRGDYFEMVSLADWITQLQPDNGLVWAMQAWNLSYNLSVQFDQPADRWRWVQSGISLLRDQGLRFNPHSIDLYRELAWFYQDKIGSNTDYAHRAYKQAWANEMQEVLGPHQGPAKLANPQTDDDRQRAARLLDHYRLDPQRMQRVDEEFGPFDWRLPEPHAIYWAALGIERCRDLADITRLRRVIWQSVERSFQRGRIVRTGASIDLEYGPNLDLVPNAWRVYEEMKRQEPGREDYIGRGQSTFIREAICLLYAHHRVSEADHWFEVACNSFPAFAEPNTGLEEFVVAQVSRQAGDGKLNRVLALLEGLLGRHYRHLALGEEDAANGHALLVRRIWEAYQVRQAGFLETLSLPSLSQLQARVLEQIRAGQHGFTPDLRQALGLAETVPNIDTNPPANPTPALPANR